MAVSVSFTLPLCKRYVWVNTNYIPERKLQDAMPLCLGEIA